MLGIQGAKIGVIRTLSSEHLQCICTPNSNSIFCSNLIEARNLELIELNKPRVVHGYIMRENLFISKSYFLQEIPDLFPNYKYLSMQWYFRRGFMIFYNIFKQSCKLLLFFQAIIKFDH